MRLFIDQDVYANTIALLSELGHDVECAADVGLARATDREILAHATAHGRVLVTRDLGFGHLVHLAAPETVAPVIVLRVELNAVVAVHQQLRRVLEKRTAEELAGAVVVVEPGRYRIRRVAGP